MVMRLAGSGARQTGALMVELLVAMALVAGALLPLAYSLASEKRLVRATYQRAVAMEIVDGEMEVLAAGAWRAHSAGAHDYPIHSIAATNLPPGHFLLTVQGSTVRLEWRPRVKMHGGAIVREVTLK